MSRGTDLGTRLLMAVLMAAAGGACVEDAPAPPGSGDGGLGDGSTDATGAGGTGRGGAGGTGAGGTAGTGGTGAGMGGSTGMGGAAGSIGGPGSVAGTVVRTFGYHELTAFPATTRITGPAVISADGSRIAYPVAPGTGDPANPNRIFVMNADGTGNVMVDSYKSLCFCNSMVAVSADGRTIVSSDSVQVRVVGIDGTLKGSLITGSNEISNIDISADGSTVYMLERRDNSINGGPVERGLWAMSANGTNHRQLIGPTAIAAAAGVTPDKVFPFSGCGKSLEVSGDGSKGIVSLHIGGLGDHAFAFDSGGAVVRRVKGPVQNVQQVAISSDGTKLAMSTTHMGMEEVSVAGIDGGGAKVLGNQPQGSCFSPLTINADGSQVLSGSIGLLYSTAGGDPLTLHLSTGGDGYGIGAPCCDVDPVFSMNGDSKRFAYLNLDGSVAGSVRQIGLLEINPASLGASPTITSPTLSAGSIPRDRSLGSAVSCRVAPAAGTTLVRAGTAVLLRGVEDRAGSWVSGSQPLRDDGMRGDPTANDGIFTSDAVITSGTGGEVGARIVRIKAEGKAGDGRRHATAIDFSGLEVK